MVLGSELVPALIPKVFLKSRRTPTKFEGGIMIKKFILATLSLALLTGAAFAAGGTEQGAGDSIVLKMGDNIPDRTTG